MVGPKLVIKLGTSSLFDEATGEHRLSNMSQIVEQVVALRKRGYRVCLVSSGAIAAGLRRLNLDHRPKHNAQLQATAATGQARLIRLWDNLFSHFDTAVGQVLLTRNDIAHRSSYLNAANTINALLDMDIVPIVNENDTLSTYEIRFGDNDTLSAVTGAMIGADMLFLLTDVDCLYTSNPRNNPDAQPIRIVENAQEIKRDPSMSQGSGVGTGGMTTKLIAANLATSAGITTYICRSFVIGSVFNILDDVEKKISPLESNHLYTRFDAHPSIKDRAFWLLHGLKPHGSITIDAGAFRALSRRDRAGLLPVGLVAVSGSFHESECVNIFVQEKPEPVGRCLVNYTSVELDRIKQHHSHDIPQILGYTESEYVAFRDNIALFPDPVV
ncbi:putative glutamate 5-kinase [Wickerhamiella sorbophila]|uniref:Putative glutamate 5-kinase n=1 Tax=Wickerhamiella sorbophila TaxID=45607 RepID=A0A2T0FLU2_9ASCO|nr:putative glutamate 5-kinase [Wickerhamiella sorbophila]PRT55949.1 putative glutamate 5-kinase [Wickerhamiella sorbophila]